MLPPAIRIIGKAVGREDGPKEIPGCAAPGIFRY